jgi:DNA-binding beta-propeller fold protein YncE
MRHRKFWAAAAVLVLVIAACNGDDDVVSTGISQADLDAANTAAAAAAADATAAEAAATAAEAQVTALEGEISDLEAQLVSGAATVSQDVIQTGSLAAAPPTGDFGNDWANAESVRGGLWLVAEFDDYMEGEPFFDVAAHPRVYFTSESYANDNPVIEDVENFIGWHVIDAYSKNVVGSRLYSYQGDISRGPHGVGVSPDGKWGYVGWSESPETADVPLDVFGPGDRISYVGIIYVPTGKLAKILMTAKEFEGDYRSQALHHIQCWTVDATDQDLCILQWGFGANGGPHHIIDPNDDNRVFRSITYDDVKPMGHPFTTPSPDGQYVYVSMGANWIRGNHSPAAAVAKVDVLTGEPTVIEGTGWHPIGITHTQDGKFTYLIDGHSSHVYMIDNREDEVIRETSTGIAGPYGICLNWDESQIWVVGKGEGTHNRGNSISLVDSYYAPRNFRGSRDFNQPLYLGGSASSVDHCALHPDEAVNEVWVSNMNGWETIVVDPDNYVPTDHIATPNGGDTHGMAFVWYDMGGAASWDNGVLMGDMGGPKYQGFQDRVLELATAAIADCDADRADAGAGC